MGDANKAIVDISARCACGATGIAVKGAILTTFLCACHECQRITGSGHTTVALTKSENVTVTGEPATFERPADSGGTVRRYFCAKCGISLYSTTTSAPTLVILPVGLFPDNDWYSPNQVIFNKSHAHWDSLPDNIPAYETYKRK